MAIEKVLKSIATRLRKEYPHREIYISNSLKGEEVHINELDDKIIPRSVNKIPIKR